MNAKPPGAKAWWATTPLSGAIGILHLDGDCDRVLAALVGRVPKVGASALVSLASIDHGLVVRPDERSALLMPHGGPQIRRRLSEAVVEAGAVLVDPWGVDPRSAWPEAETLLEACMLDALSRTSSPMAIDLLLDQPRLHEEARSRGWRPGPEDLERAKCLAHLIDPPLVAIVGAPNAGKSSLLNRLVGREAAVTADLAGTTRDAVSSRVVLEGLAGNLVDLPGERRSDDPVEQRAIEMGRRFLEEADLLVALVTPEDPDLPPLLRRPDLVVTNKVDLGPAVTEHGISALTGKGLPELARRIRETLLPEAVLRGDGRPWLFHPALREDEAD